MSNNFLPLNVPTFFKNEKKYLNDCIDSTWVSTAGKYVNKFEEKISEFTNSKYAIACCSGTAALQVSLKVAGIQSDDEIIVPTVTFIAPINAIKYNGAHPIFFDVDDYFNIDIKKLISFLNDETFFENGRTYNKRTKRIIRGILPVHVWGNASNLEPVISILKEREIKIIEDASESLGTTYRSGKLKGFHTGTVGELGCLSFNGNKIITTGGGGVILTNDIKFAEKSRYLTNQAKDDPIKFIHNEIGFNYRLTNLQAAVGLAQLENLNEIIKRKEYIHKYYTEAFNDHKKCEILQSPNFSNSNNWMNILLIDQSISLDIVDMVKFFKDQMIEIRPVWYPNHLQKPYKTCENYKISNALNLISKSICLPSSFNLRDQDIEKVYDTTINYLEKIDGKF